MIEVEFRKLLIPVLPREIEGLRTWIQNTGEVVVPGKKPGDQRVFSAGPPKGAADLSGILAPEGARVEIELKSPTAVLTREQELWGKAIANLGGIYVMFRMETTDGTAELPKCIAAVRFAIDEWRGRRVGSSVHPTTTQRRKR